MRSRIDRGRVWNQKLEREHKGQPKNMNMDKTIKRTLFAAVALLGAGVTLYGAYGLMASQPQAAPMAVPITGSITIKGGAQLNSTSVNTATKVTGLAQRDWSSRQQLSADQETSRHS